jgi:choline dehydrogenase-like flavoprotein
MTTVHEPLAEVGRARALAALCDTLIPSVADSGSVGAAGATMLSRSAGDLGIAAQVEAGVAGQQAHVRAVVSRLLTALEADGFAGLPLDERTARLHVHADADTELRFALRVACGMAYGLFVAAVGDDGRNPNWEAIGYPGPLTAPPSPDEAPKTLRLETVDPAGATLQADVCVVGSGGGGSVIAAHLARAGRQVLVLERAKYRNRADFRQLELAGSAELYLHGGVTWSDDGALGLLAGSTLGGGVVINSMVCLRPPEHVRRAWAAAGLEGVDGPDFEADVEAVWSTLGATTAHTVGNRNTQLMERAFDELGLAHQLLARNARSGDDPRFCGYCNWGCQQGCKRTTLETYLQDACDHGAGCVVDCRVERILIEDGRATGVEAVVEDERGRRRLVVEAPVVVLAAGGIESPAVLLRSGIGGPAVGRHLHVHPAYMVGAVYDETVEAWSGQIQSAASFDHAWRPDGGGFLLESLTLAPGMWAGNVPWTGGREHKKRLLDLPRTAMWHAVCLDHGEGSVALDEEGDAVVRWRLDDPIDRRSALDGHETLVRMHEAAGAQEIVPWIHGVARWRRGDDLDAYVAALREAPSEHIPAFSAHQMSSCRMGADPATSVADGRGELHHTKGVWVGDASALPTSPGVNPMISLMALAQRTARHLEEETTP